MKTFSKISALIFFCSFSFLSFLSAQEWSNVHPFSEYTRYVDGDFRDNGQIILVGKQGRIMRSTNGSQDWSEQHLSINEELTILHAIPGTAGQELLLGAESKMFKSIDSGVTWNLVAAEYTFDDIIDIEVVSADVIYVSDRSATVYKSIDGGDSWTANTFADEHFFWDFSFITEDYGWGLTPQREVYLTTDGGMSWDSIGGVPSGAGRGIGFVDENVGYIAATTSHFYKTTDGGLTWNHHDEAGYANNIKKFYMIDEALFYAVNFRDARLYYTTDAGVNWQVHNLTDYAGSNYYTFKFQENGTMWALGDRQVVTSSSDQGQTWTDLFPGIKYDIPHVRFKSKDLGFAAGRYSPLLKTDDEGKTWDIANSQGQNILGFEINNEGVLFVTRTYDGVWSSTNNGVDWQQLLSDVSAVRTIHLTPNGTLFAASGVGASDIHRSKDDGANWESMASPNEIELRGMAFPSDDIGYGWHDENLITTNDGGDSWNIATIDFEGKIRKMKFTDSANGLLLTSTHFYTTNDSGASWNQKVRPPRAENVVFQNELVGWAVGGSIEEGNIYMTTDGGNSWSLQFTNEYFYLDIQLASTNPRRLVAAGNGGVISSFEEMISGVFVPSDLLPGNIYPNPGTDEIVLDQIFGEDAQLQIYNLQGELLRQSNVSNTDHPSIGTDNLLSGKYFFRVIENGNVWFSSWVKL